MNDQAILEMFKEKNNKILVDKLLMDIANNDDSLRLTINNKIELITLKLQKRLNDFLKQNKIDYDIKSLSEFIDKNQKRINGYIMEIIDLRKQNLDNNVKSGMFELKLTEEKEKKELKEALNLKINKTIYVEMLDKLYNMYTFNNEKQKDDLIEKCLKKYDFELSLAIVDTIIYRNDILSNVMNETKKRVQELNDITSNKFQTKYKKVA